MLYGVLAILVFVAVIAFVAFSADPMVLGRSLNRSFTRGMDTIFGTGRQRHHRP